MLHVYEFEIVEQDGFFLVFPYDLEGGTQGLSFHDACEMAADWLQAEMEYRDMRREPFPVATFGNKPRYGGQNVILGVVAGRDTVNKVSAAKAAKMLGVTPGRVTQMIAANQLTAFKDDDGVHTWVTVDSIEARIAENPKAGRPRKVATA